MLEKEVLENGRVRVTFHLPDHIWADCIALVGEFNDWDARSHLLHQTHIDHSWHTSVDLDAGRSYCFRYLVDGMEWMDDNHADGYQPNPFGGFDSVVKT
jgi:1,4-alpha-glucan branching enzyme